MTTALATKPIDYDNIVLSGDQQTALDGIYNFLLDPDERVFVLEGYSGCGKSTLVRTFLDRLPSVLKMEKLVNKDMIDYEVMLTASTNKAAETLAQMSGQECRTIHSALGLRLFTDYSTGKTSLSPKNADILERKFLVIDEFSFIDSELLNHIFTRTRNCKVLFVGDPAQLSPVKSSKVPVIEAGFAGAKLREVMRQPKGDDPSWVHPITALGAQFRHTVETGEWLPFKPDGVHIIHLERDAFNEAIKTEFTRPEWNYRDSTVLGYTNKRVIQYNQFVSRLASGHPNLQVGDYAICNSFVAANKVSFKTDEMVHITGISHDYEEAGVMGKEFTLNGKALMFMPNSLADKNARLKVAKAQKDWSLVQRIEQQWVDLRASFARTVNKAQGSTHARVFMDLDDIASCTNGDTIARLMYVGVTRAQHQVFMTGDFA